MTGEKNETYYLPLKLNGVYTRLNLKIQATVSKQRDVKQPVIFSNLKDFLEEDGRMDPIVSSWHFKNKKFNLGSLLLN